MWKPFSCQYTPKKVFSISQISWGVFFCVCVYHLSSLLPVKFPGPWIFLPSLFFILQLWKPFFQLLSLAFLTSITVTLTLGKIRGLASRILSCRLTLSAACLLCFTATSSATTPTLPQRGRQSPQQNCEQNQSCYLGESSSHRGTSWQGFPRDLNSRRSRAPHLRR